MSELRKWHVELICITAVLLGVIVLDTVILPRAPDDAFKAASTPRAEYKGELDSRHRTNSGWMHTGKLCRDINVWHADKLPTNTSLKVTGSFKDNTLFVNDVTKR